MVIAEGINLLSYTDGHASWLPFFNMLPPDIAIEYAHRSPRDALRTSIAWAKQESRERAIEMRQNFGTAFSYHDFEIAFECDDLRPFVLDDGMDAGLLTWYGPKDEEAFLWRYMQDNGIKLTQGFSRQIFSVIFQKP